MHIKKIKLSQLNPAPYNPRKDLQAGDVEYEKLKKSIGEFGFIEPIVVNSRNNRVISGHQRLKVLLDDGIEQAECVVVDFDEQKEKACNIAMNKQGGTWDIPKLTDLLGELDNGAVDMEALGFDVNELEALMTRTVTDADIVPEDKPREPRTIKCPECGHEFEV